MKDINWIISNWTLIIVAISAIIVAASFVVNFFQKPTPQQLAQLKAWMLYAVSLAERELGSGTGKLKLRYVYDLFITKFEALSKMISFEQFSALVDEVLEDMKEMLKTNKNIQSYIGVEVTPEKEETEESEKTE